MRQALLSLLSAAILLTQVLPAAALDLERRRMLTAEEHVAWRGVGRVNVSAISEQGMCTGTLVDRDLVVTAAHCLFSSRTGRVHSPGNVHFVAGWRRGTKAGHSKAAEIVIHPDYRHGGDPSLEQIASDLALIRLADPIPEDAAPAFAIGGLPPRGGALTLISYRQDRAHALTRQDGCDVSATRPEVIVLRCDVIFGASGSPVFTEVDGEPRIIAVISARGEDRANRRALAFAVRIDAAMPTILAGLR